MVDFRTCSVCARRTGAFSSWSDNAFFSSELDASKADGVNKDKEEQSRKRRQESLSKAHDGHASQAKQAAPNWKSNFKKVADFKEF